MGIDNIICDLSDSDIDRIECHDHTVKLVPKTNQHCYLLSVLEVEAIARHMGLIPETVKPASPEITNEQHYDLWKAVFLNTFSNVGYSRKLASESANDAVAAFRESLRKGGGE